MQRVIRTLLAFLLGPALVVGLVWATYALNFGDALFTVPGSTVVDLGREHGQFALRDCTTRSKPQVCELENGITDAIIRSEVGIGLWLFIASVGSGWFAWRVWRRRSSD
jgi:hypothetical protein